MAKEKSNLIKLTSNLTSFDYSEVGDYDKNGTPHPIDDVEAQYDKLDVDEGQLIKRDIGERYTFSQGDNVSIDGGFVRGGAATKVQRQLEDQKRIAKFLTTPKGALFVLKQGILQNQNADRETNIYNPLSLNKSLIDTLSTRPQRHINEAKIGNRFSSLGSFFSFLLGNNNLEQGRKNGNSISNNRDVQNLKPDVEEFGGKVGIDYTSNKADINTNNEIDVSGPNERRRTRKYIPFGDTNDKIRKQDDDSVGTLFSHRAGAETVSTLEIPSRNSAVKELSFLSRKDGSKEKARDYKTNKVNPSGDLLKLPRYDTTDKEDLVTNFGTDVMPSGKNVKPFVSDGFGGGGIKGIGKQIKANQFFNVKSKGTRKLQVKYGGEPGETLRIDKDTPLPDDFIKFRIRDVVNGRWIIFPAIFTAGITDNSQATYNPVNYIGRPDAVHIYQNRTRSISFGFKVVALNEEDIPIIWEKMNYLKGLTLPQYKRFFSDQTRIDNTRPVAPIINLTIGDMFVNTPGYFTSVSVTVGNSATWETKEGRQFPHVCDVSVEFTYIGQQIPEMLGQHYDGAERVQSVQARRAEEVNEILRTQDFVSKIKKNSEAQNESFNKAIDDARLNIQNSSFNTPYGLSPGNRGPFDNVSNVTLPNSLTETTQTQNISDFTAKIRPKFTGNRRSNSTQDFNPGTSTLSDRFKLNPQSSPLVETFTIPARKG